MIDIGACYQAETARPPWIWEADLRSMNVPKIIQTLDEVGECGSARCMHAFTSLVKSMNRTVLGPAIYDVEEVFFNSHNGQFTCRYFALPNFIYPARTIQFSTEGSDTVHFHGVSVETSRELSPIDSAEYVNFFRTDKNDENAWRTSVLDILRCRYEGRLSKLDLDKHR